MKLHHPSAEIFIPDRISLRAALARVTHLGIGAHQDDLEFMALHGILACYGQRTRSFGGVTCTDGAGSVRAGAMDGLGGEQLQAVRRREQNEAAVLGRYSVMFQLAHESASIKQPGATALQTDLQEILAATRPEIVYTHNPADKHDTHIAVVVAVLRALREMPLADRPQQVWGCEVWRGLDWMQDADKVVMDVGGQPALGLALSGVFASQMAGGKRYDLAFAGRRAANATLLDPQAPDQTDQIIFGMDLTPLAHNDSLDLSGYVEEFIERFRLDVTSRLRKQLGRAGTSIGR